MRASVVDHRRITREFTRAISRWARLWRAPSLTARVQVDFSPRLRRSLGRTRPHSGQIRLHARLAGAPRPLRLQVLCHEVAHVAVRLRFGARSKPHGPEWRSLIAAAGFVPATTLAIPGFPTPSARAVPRVRSRYRCPVCQSIYWHNQRRRQLTCAHCAATGLTIRLLPHPTV